MRCPHLERHTLDRFIPWDLPPDEMDNTFVASLLTGAMASFGIERKSNGNGNKKPAIVDNKDSKAGIK